MNLTMTPPCSETLCGWFPPLPKMPMLPSMGLMALLSESKIFSGSSSSAFSSGVCAKSLQSRPTLCDAMDCNPPGSSVRGILQARILGWVAMPSSRGSSQPRDQMPVSYVSCISRWVLYHCYTGEPSPKSHGRGLVVLPPPSELCRQKALAPPLPYLLGNANQPLKSSIEMAKSPLSPFLAPWQEVIASSAGPKALGSFLVPFIKICLFIKRTFFCEHVCLSL